MDLQYGRSCVRRSWQQDCRLQCQWRETRIREQLPYSPEMGPGNGGQARFVGRHRAGHQNASENRDRVLQKRQFRSRREASIERVQSNLAICRRAPFILEK